MGAARLAAAAGMTGALTAAGAALGGCGGNAAPLTAAQVMQYDAPSHTVQLTADAAYGGLGGDMNFDGYSNGRLSVTVPYGWIVQVTCTNDSQVLRHSCAFVADAPSQALGVRPLAFAEASSPDPYDGSPPGRKSSFEFLADHLGRYRLACLVHGHELDGMWDYLVVGPAGSLPSVTVG
ncbi:MAG TPA: sulfocyanin-like copper-binding protein [Acidimicrobiales bacterium]|nr:sulfocyanin-like copper-binding protein [Acidimicrobiales bacterium]